MVLRKDLKNLDHIFFFIYKIVLVDKKNYKNVSKREMAEISYRHPDIAIIHHALFKKCNVMFLVKKQNSNIFHSYKFFFLQTHKSNFVKYLKL